MPEFDPNLYLKRLSSLLTGNSEQFGVIRWLGSKLKGFSWVREWESYCPQLCLSAMPNIQIKGIESKLGQIVLEDIESIKRKFWYIFENSDQIYINNLIKKTKVGFSDLKSKSITYLEKYQILNSLNQEWFELWEKYRHSPEKIDLIQAIDSLTNYSIAYTYLFFSLSLINEGKTGNKKDDSERVVHGFLWLSQIIDIFIEYFSDAELSQLFFSVRSFIELSNRSLTDYFEEEIEVSLLNTQFRAYCSLIFMKIKNQINLNSNLVISYEYAEDKALRRIQEIKEGKSVKWIELEPNNVDIKSVRQSIKERGYKLSN